MSNSFIRMTAVSAKGKVLRVKSIDVPIKLCMLGSKLKNEALIWPGKLIYWILWFRFIHFLIHNSASVSYCPSVIPYLPEIVPNDVSPVWWWYSCRSYQVILCRTLLLFSKAVSIIVSSYISMSRNPLYGDLDVMKSRGG